jgi:hypothetical protein
MTQKDLIIIKYTLVGFYDIPNLWKFLPVPCLVKMTLLGLEVKQCSEQEEFTSLFFCLILYYIDLFIHLLSTDLSLTDNFNL